MAEIKILRPFKDGKEIWIGLDSPGFRRKVFQLVNKEQVGSEHIVAGLTIFEPGESSSRHNHPAAEEVDIMVRGTGDVVTEEGQRITFAEGDWVFIPKGMFHQHVNNGNEPLWLIWMYTPQGELPKS
ncbi:MAG: cupin domain-containing protein [Chloroflexi bacterium]|nr:cupin domain-containing protein [Chloroflexota bacterium]